jgi:hypothetical protein
MELCIGIAAAGGVQVAILGQSVLGYSTTLYVFAIVIFILAIIVIPIFPKDNSRDDKESLDIS